MRLGMSDTANLPYKKGSALQSYRYGFRGYAGAEVFFGRALASRDLSDFTVSRISNLCVLNIGQDSTPPGTSLENILN
jgi:hypothetical protein